MKEMKHKMNIQYFQIFFEQRDEIQSVLPNSSNVFWGNLDEEENSFGKRLTAVDNNLAAPAASNARPHIFVKF